MNSHTFSFVVVDVRGRDCITYVISIENIQNETETFSSDKLLNKSTFFLDLYIAYIYMYMFVSSIMSHFI